MDDFLNIKLAVFRRCLEAGSALPAKINRNNRAYLWMECHYAE